MANKSDVHAKIAVAAAKRGDPYALIGRLRNSGSNLTQAELDIIVGLLEATASKRILAKRERELTAIQVLGLIEDGALQKQAVADVMRNRNKSYRYVYAALAEHRKSEADKS